MAGIQTDNITILDLSTGLIRTVETGGTPDIINTSVDWEWSGGANVVIGGNLTVNGTTTTINTEQINVKDNYMYLNDGYTATTAITGGFVVNVLPTATADTVAATGFVAGVVATSNPTVITTGSATFGAGDIVQISDANNQSNDGIFEVLSHVGTTLTIRGVGLTATTQDWPQNQFTADTTVAGTITLVNVSVFCATSSGDWLVTTTNTTTGLTYETLTAQGIVDLQVAYVAGNTITTSGGEGNVVIAGSETLVVTTAGGINLDAPFDFDSTGFDVQMTGSNGFSIDGTAASNVTVTSGNLDLTTVTSGDVNVSSAGALDLDAATTATLDTADAADASGNAITVTAGSSTAGTADGANIVLTAGDGFTSGTAGFVNVTSPADEDEILLQIESTGTGANAVGLFTGTSVPSGTVTADAGSLFMRDTGTSGEVYINTSTGSGTSWTQLAAAGGNSLQAAYVVGNTIVMDSTNGDFDISGSEAISLDASAASNFTVASANLDLATTTSGDVNVSAAGEVDIDAGTTVVINTTDAADASGNDITLTAASSTAGTADGASIILATGDGFTTGVAGSVDITGPNDEDEAILTLTTTGTSGDSMGFFVGDNDPSGSITGDAGSLFVRDTGTGAELYLNTSTGAGTVWTNISGGGSVTDLQSAYVGGNTIVMDSTNGDFDVSGSEAISLDASAASNFSVASAALTLSTTTSGNLSVLAADAVLIEAGDEAALAGNTVTVNAGDGGGANDGGAISVTSGDSGAGATGNGGNLDLISGDALSTNGDGGVISLTTGANTGTGIHGFVDIGGTNNEDEALVRLTTQGTSGDSVQMFVGDSDPSGTVTGDAGSLFMRDTGTGGELYINESTGSGTVWNQVVTSGAGGGLSLQTAYVGGNTIVMDSTNGDFDVSGSEAISLDASAASNFTVASANLSIGTTTSGTLDLTAAGLMDVNAGANLDIDVTGTFDMLSSGVFSIDGTGASNVTATSGNLTLSTITSGSLIASSAADVDIDATTSMTLNTADAADASGNDITLTAASSTAGTADGASIILATGDGFTTGVAGSVDLTGPNDEGEALLTLTTTGTGGDSVQMFVGDSDPSGVVTGDAGSLFMRDTATGGELYINESTGSGTVWNQVVTSGGGGGASLTLQNAYVGGNTILMDSTNGDFDVSGSEAISLDASAASNFTVASANLTLETTTSGTIDINSAADIDITFAGANATAMVIDDGTNTYMTFDSTVAEPAVAVDEFLDIVGSGAGVTLTAGEVLIAGAVVTIEGTSGDVILADSNTGTTLDGLAIGVAAYGAADTAPVKVFTVPGSLIPVNFAAAPAAALNGRPVFVSQTSGQGTTTAPTGSGNVVYIVGILQGADGASTSPLVMYQPQFIAIRP